jgi:hypothetical protein
VGTGFPGKIMRKKEDRALCRNMPGDPSATQLFSTA